MSQPDHESIVNEIRSTRIAAPPELRIRVRAIAASAPEAPAGRRRWELPRRRLAIVLVPACAAVALAAALAVGLSSSGRNGTRAAVNHGFAASAPRHLAPAADAARSRSAGGAAGALPATAGRAQRYEAELTLKIADLSAATRRTLRLTHEFDGYVRSVEYGSGTERGSAYIVVRVPVGSVQEALVKYSAIGRILDQHVSIQDVQTQVDRRFRQMQAERDLIAKLQAKLENPSLSGSERAQLENRLVAARRQLVLLQKQQSALRRETAYATVSLDLRISAKTVVVPGEPGRIGRALHQSGQILADEAKVLVYVLIVGAPFFVLGALAAGGLRLRRRHSEARLLSTS
jgi:hypothetical protein